MEKWEAFSWLKAFSAGTKTIHIMGYVMWAGVTAGDPIIAENYYVIFPTVEIIYKILWWGVGILTSSPGFPEGPEGPRGPIEPYRNNNETLHVKGSVKICYTCLPNFIEKNVHTLKEMLVTHTLKAFTYSIELIFRPGPRNCNHVSYFHTQFVIIYSFFIYFIYLFYFGGDSQH